MNISLLCSDVAHPVNEYLQRWVHEQRNGHRIELVRRKDELTGGDLLFLISCSELISSAEREKYRASLVIHASDLPRGRGWSPHIWELARGAEFITVTLLEAVDEVDSGSIWKKIIVSIPKHALWNEINELLFRTEIDLLDFAVRNADTIKPVPQSSTIAPTYYPRRTPEHSRVDLSIPLSEQMDLLRVCDPQRYPAYFDYLGHRYKLILEKIDVQ